ncbi:RING finger protein 32 isoform X2 [Ictalurus furcatus]|uniref:RING finger protein 32 isoform X2 n=1 Tax=Ictalurus furcatus TaxID=66913 RepID=UPI0023501D61|nr:RING finger protein 32 isoform X2 [Ictalurus furcatus]
MVERQVRERREIGEGYERDWRERSERPEKRHERETGERQSKSWERDGKETGERWEKDRSETGDAHAHSRRSAASCHAVATQPGNQSNQGHQLCFRTMLKGRRSRADRRMQAMMAGALQDHIIRSVTHLQRPNLPSPSTRHTHSHTHHVDDEREFVLDSPQPPLTFAQKLGLVAAPSSRRLTIDEWTEVKSRSLLNGDSTQPCIICTEEFRLQPQACLRKFEHFSGRKCCPLCRTEQYETRAIHDGARLYREKCVLRIQAWWRGCVARQWYRDVRKVVPPSDPRLRRRFFEEKFQQLNTSLVQSCHSDVDSFLREIDQSVAQSRDVFHLFDRLQTSSTRGMEEEEWRKAQEKAAQRDTYDCPICLTPLRSAHSSTPVVLLSCSHLFHQSCLRASEHFCQEGGATCPLCRRHYVSVPVYDFAHYHTM